MKRSFLLTLALLALLLGVISIGIFSGGPSGRHSVVEPMPIYAGYDDGPNPGTSGRALSTGND
jgi:hypothetical protein